jgi:hypothetical protein
VQDRLLRSWPSGEKAHVSVARAHSHALETQACMHAHGRRERRSPLPLLLLRYNTSFLWLGASERASERASKQASDRPTDRARAREREREREREQRRPSPPVRPQTSRRNHVCSRTTSTGMCLLLLLLLMLPRKRIHACVCATRTSMRERRRPRCRAKERE